MKPLGLAGPLRPVGCAQGGVTEPAEEAVVARPVPQLAQRDHEHRRRRLAAVVRVARAEAEHRERAAAELVEHLAGLGVAPRVVRRRLGRGRDLQRPVEGLGPGHRRLPARRERVSPEVARECRHAGVEDPAAPAERRQRPLAVEQVVLEVGIPQANRDPRSPARTEPGAGPAPRSAGARSATTRVFARVRRRPPPGRPAIASGRRHAS